LVQAAGEALVGALAHHALPYELLLEDLQPGRDAAGSSLFDVLLNFVGVPRIELSLSGLDVRAEPTPEPPSKLALTFYVEQANGGLEVRLSHDVRRLSARTAQDLLAQFVSILDQMAADPDATVSDVALVTPAARSLLPDPTARLAAEPPMVVTE